MSKSKKSILTTLVAFVMLLALSVSTLTGLTAKADDPITSTDFVTGGTAYEPEAKTVTNGTIAYTTDWTVTSAELYADQKGPYSGAVPHQCFHQPFRKGRNSGEGGGRRHRAGRNRP